jgi:transposase-like protein
MRRGRGRWDQDKPAIFTLVERGGSEEYVPSSNVEGETARKVVGRRVSKGSRLYTDSFHIYLGLDEVGRLHP